MGATVTPRDLRLLKRTIGTALFVAAAACGSAHDEIASEPLDSNRSAIVGGTTDPGDPWAVGVCASFAFPNTCTDYCTGTLIAPNLVLTARHCVDNYTRVPPACTTGNCPMTCDSYFTPIRFGGQTGYGVTTSGQWTSTSTWHYSSKVLRATGTSFCDSDVALIVLPDNIPASEAQPVAPLVYDSMTSHPQYSTTFTEIGFGVTAANGTDGEIRRIRQNNQISCIPGDPTIPCTPSTGGRFVSPTGEQFGASNFLAGQVACNGDSGGPVIDQATYDAGNPLVYGITSRVGRGATQCTFSIFNRTDQFTSLIVNAASTAAQMGGYPLPSWAVSPTCGVMPACSCNALTCEADGSWSACTDPTNLGASCSSGSVCNGKINCAGQCSGGVVEPACHCSAPVCQSNGTWSTCSDPPGYGSLCNTATTCNGTIDCTGTCVGGTRKHGNRCR